MQVRGYRIHRWGGDLCWDSWRIRNPGPFEVLVRVEACGIGLTVLNCIRGDLGDSPALLPRVPGHELVGRVEMVGHGVPDLAPGQRVMAYFYLTCGVCPACRSGRDSLCANLAGFVGVHRDGGYAPYTLLPAHNLLPLPESIPAPQATAIPDAIATSLHVCKTRAQVRPGDYVAVIGAGGGVGIHMVQMACLFGASVVGLEAVKAKLGQIESVGARPVWSPSFAELDPTALWNGRRPSVVIDLVGTTQSLAWSLDALSPGGRLVVLTTFRDVSFVVDPRALVLREAQVLGSRYASRAEVLDAVQLVENDSIQPVVSRVVPPEDVAAVHCELTTGSLVGRGAIQWSSAP
jgi:D-arabinose 1-dehydrogenase-like Zn-dependent alcohol dehydrogenase